MKSRVINENVNVLILILFNCYYIVDMVALKGLRVEFSTLLLFHNRYVCMTQSQIIITIIFNLYKRHALTITIIYCSIITKI